MDSEWVHRISSFFPDRLATLGPREAAAMMPLITAPALDLLMQLGVPLVRSDEVDTAEHPRDSALEDETAMQAFQAGAKQEVAGESTHGLDSVPVLQALTVLEAMFYFQWASLDWPHSDLDALLSWWGGNTARNHRLRLRPRGVERVYFGKSASNRTRLRLEQLLGESELGRAALGS